MAILIDVPSIAWGLSSVTLDGKNYFFDFQFNDREQRWYVDIYLNNELVIRGVKLVEYSGLINKYDLELFNHGRLFVEAQKRTTAPAGFDNIGIGKEYIFFYLSNEELGI